MSTKDMILSSLPFVFAIVVYLSLRNQRKLQRKEALELEQEMAVYNKKLDEDRALYARISELSWAELLELRKRHGERYKTDREEIRDIDRHVCPGIPGFKYGQICWFEIVRKEIVRRIERLLSARDLKGLQDLVADYDLDQAWEAIGKTPEGVVWLEDGCHSHLPKLRARCFKTLRGE